MARHDSKLTADRFYKLLFVLLGLVCGRTGFLLVGYILDRYVYSAGNFGCSQTLSFGENCILEILSLTNVSTCSFL